MSDSSNDQRSVYCRSCDAWRHPRHSCARTPAHDTVPRSIRRLRRRGPSSIDVFGDHESGTNPETRRDHDVGKFDPSGTPTGTASTFGSTRPVYYLVDEHDPETVIERWLETNAEALAGRDLTTENVSRAISKRSFRRAWRRLRERREFAFLDPPTREGRGGDQSQDRTCPLCGDRVPELPAHLPCEGV